MTDVPQSRRETLKLLGGGVLGAQAISGATATTEPNVGERRARTGRGNATAATTEAASEGAVTEMMTVRFEPDEPALVYEFEYEIPEGVSELDIEFDGLLFPGFRGVRETNNVEQLSSEFVWTGDGKPRVVIESRLDTDEFEEFSYGYQTGSEAFEYLYPHTEVIRGNLHKTDIEIGRWEATFDGQGIATREMVYAGPYESETVTVDETSISLVVPEHVQIDTDVETSMSLFQTAQEFLGDIPTDRSEKVGFVVAMEASDWLGGREYEGSFMVTENRWNLDSISNIPAHEFAHTVFGGFGEGRTEWLTEALAEYYGNRASLKAGIDGFTAFYQTVNVYEETDRDFDEYVDNDVVLADEQEVKETWADYTKGAHVLGALDAEIRRRTDGEKALRDVFEMDYDIERLSRFRAAVIELTDDESMGEWLYEYVTTYRVPELPSDPELYGLTERFVVMEIGPGRKAVYPDESFVPTVRIRNTGESSETATVTLNIDGQQYETKQAEIGAEMDATLRFDSVDRSDFSRGEHSYAIHVDDTERMATTVRFTAPPEFKIEQVEPETPEVEQGEQFDVTAKITNVGGNGKEDVPAKAKLYIGENHPLGGPPGSDRLSLAGGESATAEFTDIDTSGLEIGEHLLNVETQHDAVERTLRVIDSTESDGSGPGFGVGTVITGLGGVGYLLKRRLTDSDDDS